MATERAVELCIEAASDDLGVALSIGGVVSLARAWRTQQQHSAELLPNIARLLVEAGRERADIAAVFVDIGPGGYAALRVGVSVAKALAHALGVPLAGIGRLELDAWAVAHEAAGRRIVAVHRAGRGELAWAAYRGDAAGWSELAAPRIAPPEALHAALSPGDAVTGDIDDATAAAIVAAGAATVAAQQHRVAALAAVGARRLAEGRTDAAEALVPLYLRAPAIGPTAAGQ